MAISPTVQAYMQDAEGKAPSSAEQMFIKRFADQAFNTLRAKNPEIINLVVTFKVLESDIDKASAMGVFALQVGKDIRYLPVILSRGSLTSCEMIYNKTEDQLMPLTDKFSRDLLAANHLSDATVLNRSPRVEDTRTLFRDMVRPPASSNVILAASSEGVAALPGKAKEALAEYFEAHPELLAKIADFYAVEELAEKLAYREEVMPAINPTPTVVRVEDLTKAAAHFLTREEQTIMLADGYIVKKAADSTVLVAPLDSLSQEAETTLRIEAYTGNKGLLSQVLLANALCCTPEGFHREPVLTLGNAVLSIQGKRTDADERAVLLEQASPRVTSENLRRFGAVPGGAFFYVRYADQDSAGSQRHLGVSKNSVHALP